MDLLITWICFFGDSNNQKVCGCGVLLDSLEQLECLTLLGLVLKQQRSMLLEKLFPKMHLTQNGNHSVQSVELIFSKPARYVDNVEKI